MDLIESRFGRNRRRAITFDDPIEKMQGSYKESRFMHKVLGVYRGKVSNCGVKSML